MPLKKRFRADARKDDIISFGDVVTFGMTYLTNRYGRQFAPFTRVNHHGQSVL